MIPLRDDNPTRSYPVHTVLLIAVNVLVFIYQLSLGQRQEQALVFQFGAIPAVIVGTRTLPEQLATIPPVLSLFTSMFLHGGFMHIIGNMLYLWIFGNNIEDAMGRVRFLIFYLTCGVLAALAHILSNPSSVIPTIGSSGAKQDYSWSDHLRCPCNLPSLVQCGKWKDELCSKARTPSRQRQEGVC